MKRVIIESPFAGEVERNIKYAKECMADSLKRGEAPFASHLLYTQEGILDDLNIEERTLGINAGFAWGEVADCVVVYEDYGISGGMALGIERAREQGLPIDYRKIHQLYETLTLSYWLSIFGGFRAIPKEAIF